MVLAGLLATLVLSIVPAAPAPAGEVHFDPDSPAGKEYALPLPQARNEALGGEGIGDRPPSEATLFGVGIGGSGDGGAGQGDGGSSPSGGSSNGQNGTTPSSETERPASKSAVATQGSSYSSGTAMGLLAGILLIALVLGIALRALTRTEDLGAGPTG